MPECKVCEDEVDELVKVRVDGRTKRMCEDCADRLREEAEIAEESEAVIQQMMGFSGRR
jgi:ribosome-binding protein aMBF1 (putative translation factor)